MRLVHRWRDPKREYDIRTAIVSECDSCADGTVESARDVADNAAEKLGVLVALLHSKGILADADVLQLVRSFDVAP